MSTTTLNPKFSRILMVVDSNKKKTTWMHIFSKVYRQIQFIPLDRGQKRSILNANNLVPWELVRSRHFQTQHQSRLQCKHRINFVDFLVVDSSFVVDKTKHCWHNNGSKDHKRSVGKSGIKNGSVVITAITITAFDIIVYSYPREWSYMHS